MGLAECRVPVGEMDGEEEGASDGVYVEEAAFSQKHELGFSCCWGKWERKGKERKGKDGVGATEWLEMGGERSRW